MNKQVSSLMQKEVSRKEFIGMSGLAIASVFGLGGALKLLTGKSFTGNRHMSSGYGSSPYGR